ncbi:hypothetical protein HRD49_10920 [Corallococcus exiguus]|uniref:Lipoprotein n=1 Tax=Corallococcus exiguus TaxID=83462 RepID=A0A7X4YKH5_9BACT|nr:MULTISPECIES: hypothetical protein [Corallococcus]NBC46032.1 hypothetical protein [Corallococcus exiguus]NNC18453.1 hypothetical protein [Corallococcus exiguus]NRD52719.1 hypothetical protein [Corallococcus exiguus]NRD62257.1 hypothetical protein [Corallococcus exiguus]RKH27560.1 hypothetical protein D7V77_11445 [Corallococcus sp. CA041A]
MRRPTLLMLALLAGCGPDATSEALPLGLDITLSRAVASQVGAYQVAVLKDGTKRNCTELQRTCLSSQVSSSDLLELKDADGNSGRTLRFPSAPGGAAMGLSVDVPVGRDYALVIEALTADTPTRFLGSSCNYLRVVNSGTNATLVAAPIELTTQSCDPVFPR